MRICLIAFLFAGLSLQAVAAPISPGEALVHIGGLVTVEGIASVSTPSTGTVTFVEVSMPGNGATVQGVIYVGDQRNFSDLASYNGKKVQLTGPVQTFKGALRIVLRTQDQLKLVEPPKP
jgi:predicted extracellular nuclease